MADAEPFSPDAPTSSRMSRPPSWADAAGDQTRPVRAPPSDLTRPHGEVADLTRPLGAASTTATAPLREHRAPRLSHSRVRRSTLGVSALMLLLLLAGVVPALAMDANSDDDAEIVVVLDYDSIPAVDDPQWDSGSWLDPWDEVIVHELDNGSAKAYPIRILDWHEIVNDVVDGEPLSVTWCPLCGTSISWKRTIDDNVTTLGVSGRLYRNTMVMFDRETRSLWSQHTGVALQGVHMGDRLSFVPNTVATAGWVSENYDDVAWLARPLDESGNHMRNYAMPPYQGYESSDEIWFPVQNQAPNVGELTAKSWVVGFGDNDSGWYAIGMDHIREHSPTLIPWGNEFLLGVAYGSDDVRLYRWDPLHPAAVVGDVLARDLTSMWHLRNGTSLNASTADLLPVPFIRNFWFGWYDFHPETGVYVGEAIDAPTLDAGTLETLASWFDADVGCTCTNVTVDRWHNQTITIVQQETVVTTEEGQLHIELLPEGDHWRLRTESTWDGLNLTGVSAEGNTSAMASSDGPPVGVAAVWPPDGSWLQRTNDTQANLTTRMTVVDFAAGWCSFCEPQFAVLDDWMASESRVNVVTAWANDRETNESWADAGFDDLVTWDLLDDGAALWAAAGSPALPALALVDGGGRILEVHVGLLDADGVTELVDRHTATGAPFTQTWTMSQDELRTLAGGSLVLDQGGRTVASLPVIMAAAEAVAGANGGGGSSADQSSDGASDAADGDGGDAATEVGNGTQVGDGDTGSRDAQAAGTGLASSPVLLWTLAIGWIPVAAWLFGRVLFARAPE